MTKPMREWLEEHGLPLPSPEQQRRNLEHNLDALGVRRVRFDLEEQE